jgi:hypothetical protein
VIGRQLNNGKISEQRDRKHENVTQTSDKINYLQEEN